MSGEQDHYKILEVERTADDATIKSAYRKLAMKFHPDRVAQNNPGVTGDALEALRKTAEAKFKQLGDAHDILKDPQKRAAYDRFGHQPFQGSSHSWSPNGAGKAGARAGTRAGSGGFGGAHGFNAGTSAFDDIFDDIFGPGWRKRDFSGAKSNGSAGSAKSSSHTAGGSKSSWDSEFAERMARHQREHAERMAEMRRRQQAMMDDILGGHDNRGGAGAAGRSWSERLFTNAAGDVHYGKVTGVVLGTAAIGYGIYALSKAQEQPQYRFRPPAMNGWANQIGQMRMAPIPGQQI